MRKKKPARTVDELILRDAKLLNKLDSHLGCVMCKQELQDGQCLTIGCPAYDPAFILTEEELEGAIARALDSIGLDNFEDLKRQAEAGKFNSERARRTWFAIAAFMREDE